MKSLKGIFVHNKELGMWDPQSPLASESYFENIIQSEVLKLSFLRE